MDDPWGSPWTSAGPAEGTPSPSKSDLEPPPRAFLSVSNSPRLPAVSVESPWADDNHGLGDGAAADSTTASAHSPSAYSPANWGGAWGGADARGARDQRHLTPTPGDEGFGFGQASPIAWPSSIASPSPKHGNAFRQPSPDPWASEFDDLREAKDVQSAPHPVLDRGLAPTLMQELGSGQPEEELGSVWERENGGAVADASTEGAAVAHEEEDQGAATTIPAGEGHRSDGSDQPRLSTSSKPRSSHSRSSSVSRNDSDFDGERQDSPITSIDDDAKSRLALPPRKVSGQVQVLVQKYDGLAQAAVGEPLPFRRNSGPAPPSANTPGTEAPSEEITDFGDFEEAEKAPPTPPLQYSEPSSPRHPLEQTPPPQTVSQEKTPSVADGASANAKSATTKRPPIKFEADLEQIDELFDGLQPGLLPSHAKLESSLPDHVITDSFTQISERKAWYRISRQGSSRMHNSGDDDSYRRVAWPTSTVHGETLKIVRRWMEQDSITGRTTLGGGTTRTSMFNWDSAAEPVALEEIFAKRRRQPRPTSLQQPMKMSSPIPPAPASASSINSAVAAPTHRRPMSLAGPPAAALGWSPSPIEQRPAGIQTTRPSKLGVRQEPRQALSPNNPPIQTPAAADPPVPQEEDDDDWGEMVSSPPVDADPMAFPAIGLPETTGVASVAPSIWPVPAASGGRDATNGLHSSLEDGRELPQPEKSRKEVLIDGSTTAEPLSYFGQPVKPTVATATSITNPSLKPTTPLAIMSPLPTPAETLIEQTGNVPPLTNEQTNIDSAARRIVDSLPDLSYMLR